MGIWEIMGFRRFVLKAYSMIARNTLFMWNKGRYVTILFRGICITSIGPKSLVRLEKINDFYGVICIDCLFKYNGRQWVTEDYYDIVDLFNKFHYDSKILKKVRRIRIVR